MEKSAVILPPCSRQRHSPHTKSYNFSTSMTVHFHLVQEKISNVAWNSSSTTLPDLVWKCILGKGRHRPKPNAYSSPPQFFQHAQHHDVAATLIQRAFRRTHTNTHPHQLIEQPAPSSTCPMDFPIRCRVVVASSHPTHAGKGVAVCKLTKKFVLFSPDDSPTNEHTPQVTRCLPSRRTTKNKLCQGRQRTQPRAD